MGSATTAPKSNAIRRLLFCFRPNVAHDDDDVSPIPTMNPHRLTTKDAVAAADLLASIAVDEKERFVLPGASLPAGEPEPEPDDDAGLPRKESSKRFSKIIMKAVTFEKSLSKKMLKRKNSAKSSPITEDEPSAETTPQPHSTAEESSESDNGGGGAGPSPSSSSSSGSLTETCTTDSPSSSFTIGSSSSMSGSSFPSISRTTSLQCGKSFEATPEEPPPKQAPPQPRVAASSRHSDSIRYQCLFLLSLAALVFFGKACAIFCTSVCFYFVPRLSRPRRDRSPPPSKAACLHIDTEDNRRRVDH